MSLTSMIRRAGKALALAVALTSCTTYEFRRQDLAFRHDAESDSLELLIVTEGLLKTGEKSAEQVHASGAGARHAILLGWPFEFDLAEIEADLAQDDTNEPLRGEFLRWMGGIHFADSGVWQDEVTGELSLHQRITIDNASHGIDLLNRAINAECKKGETWTNVAATVDAETGDLWKAHIDAGRPWVELRDGGVVVHVPVSPGGAARWLELLVREKDDDMLPIVEPLTAMRLADGLASFHFAPDATGWVRLKPVHSPPDDAEPVRLRDGTQQDRPPLALMQMLQAPRR